MGCKQETECDPGNPGIPHEPEPAIGYIEAANGPLDTGSDQDQRDQDLGEANDVGDTLEIQNEGRS